MKHRKWPLWVLTGLLVGLLFAPLAAAELKTVTLKVEGWACSG